MYGNRNRFSVDLHQIFRTYITDLRTYKLGCMGFVLTRMIYIDLLYLCLTVERRVLTPSPISLKVISIASITTEFD